MGHAALVLVIGFSGDLAMVELLLQIMETIKADYTQTFRDLSELSLDNLKNMRIPESAWGLHQCLGNKRLKTFLETYVERIEKSGVTDEERMTKMQKVNPRYILRNWIAQKAIEMAEHDDFTEVEFLLELLRNPFRTNEKLSVIFRHIFFRLATPHISGQG